MSNDYIRMNRRDGHISREAIRDRLHRIIEVNKIRPDRAWFTPNGVEALIDEIPPADVLPVPPGGIGEVSDGYHTFNGLYYQRMILFAALVKQNKERAWKSHKHEDGELCFGGGWFIVGIDTPEGSYTYHYEDKDWDLFDCEELPVGKHWDGHTEDDVTRLLSLPEMRPVVDARWIDLDDHLMCSGCGASHNEPNKNYCPNCGADMRRR